MQFSRYIVICTWIVASLRRQHLRAMNIHGIRTHPPGLYIVFSVPDVLPLSHVLLYNIYKSAVPTSIPLRFISVMGFALYVRRNLCVSVQAHTQSSAVHARLIAFMHTGSHLLSRAVSSKVPSADWVLTVVFGMGTGVSLKRIATSKRCYCIYFETSFS